MGTCKHHGCVCEVAEGAEFCSDYCRDHSTHEDTHRCECGHPGCG